MTTADPHISLLHTGGNRMRGPISLVLESHLAKGWELEPLTANDEQVWAVERALFHDAGGFTDDDVAERMWRRMRDLYPNGTEWRSGALAALSAAGFIAEAQP